MAQAICKNQVIESYGPYGSQLPENYRFQLAECEHISGFSVQHGWMVDGLTFVIAKPDGSSYSLHFGGGGANNSKIVLMDGEYLTRVSGKYGYDTARKHEAVASLTIHTNLNPVGYGPYGLAKDVAVAHDFTSPVLSDGPVVGVFGRAGSEIESIGLLLRKEFPSA